MINKPTFDELLERERKLSPPQRGFLAELRAHKLWYPGCGWQWTNRSTTVRIAESLIKRGLVNARQLPDDRVEYRPIGTGQVTYLAVGPYGWARATTIAAAKKACADRCARKLRGGESYDVFVVADPFAFVDDAGRLMSDGSAFTRVAGHGNFMSLTGEEKAG